MPKTEIAANPREPQLQAPALAPIIEPNTPVPMLLELLRKILMRYTFMLITIPDIVEIATMSTKPSRLPEFRFSTSSGEMNMYSETSDNPTKSPADIATAIIILRGFEKTSLITCSN